MTKIPFLFRKTKTVRNLQAYMEASFSEVLQHLGGVHPATGAAIDNYDLLHVDNGFKRACKFTKND